MNTGVVTTCDDISVKAQQPSECLKISEDFMGREIHNTCTGATSFVPKGFLDYSIIAIMVMLFVMLFVLSSMFLRDLIIN